MTTLCASDHPDYLTEAQREAALRECVRRISARFRLNGAQSFECMTRALEAVREGKSHGKARSIAQKMAARFANTNGDRQ